ncbi:MAG: TetR/AcrR family transcriptional regulator [Pseudomonadota bacterium]|nr:TetR/AcrR family transcriptional regulator [Pseudomonadota bacterium]
MNKNEVDGADATSGTASTSASEATQGVTKSETNSDTKGEKQSSTSKSAGKLAIKQERGHITYDALIEAGFKLLVERDIEDISIFELARVAGYSVGAFYARFRSKDEFFDALIERHLERRTATQKHLVETLPRDVLVPDLISNIVDYYWNNHVFWRAVLRRTLRDPALWQPFRQHFSENLERFNARVEQDIARPLTEKEIRSITFAFQTVMGTINISIINQPGPVFIGQDLFKEELTRAFVQVSGLDDILATT